MFKTPILLLIFNRPDNLTKIIKILEKIKPSKIYISADGPRFHNSEDSKLCKDSRKLFSKLNWKCKVKKNFLGKNYGCRDAVSKGISWFFRNEKCGIILEDDCLPSKDFFKFCEKNLRKYYKHYRIGCITGNNFQNKVNIRETYYFSRYPHCWGWATWSRAWKKYQKDINFWPNYKNTEDWRNYFDDSIEQRYWTKIFNNTFLKKIDSWAYPWTISLWKNKMLTITPKSNLVKNVGFNHDATHTISSLDDMKYKTKSLVGKWKSPKKIEINIKNDEYVFNYHFKGKNYIWPFRLLYLIKLAVFSPKIFYKKLIKSIYK